MGDNNEFKELDARALIGTVDWDTGLGLGGFKARMRKAVLLDPVTHTLLTTSYPHHETHAGEHHIAIASTLVNTDGELNLLFKSPSIVPGFGATGHPLDSPRRRKAHMTLEIESALGSYMEFYKASTLTFNAGAIVPYWNRNFHAFAASEKYFTSAMSMCVTPGGTESSTTKLGPIYMGAANIPQTIRIGGSRRSGNEFILNPGDWYHIRVVSRVDNNALTIVADWYDHAEQTDYTG